MDNFVDEIVMKACYRPFSLNFRVDPLHKIENEQYQIQTDIIIK